MNIGSSAFGGIIFHTQTLNNVLYGLVFCKQEILNPQGETISPMLPSLASYTTINATGNLLTNNGNNHNAWLSRLDVLESSGIDTSNTAVRIVENLNTSSSTESSTLYNDWFVPNRQQLEKLYEYLSSTAVINNYGNYVSAISDYNIDNNNVWCSTELSTTNGACVNFSVSNSGNVFSKDKKSEQQVVAIRRVVIPAIYNVVDGDNEKIKEIVFQGDIQNQDINYTHTVVLNKISQNNNVPFYYSSFVKFTSQPVNTAAAIFGNIPNVSFIEEPITGKIYYFDSNFTSSSNLTSLTDGNAYIINRTNVSTGEFNFTLTGPAVTTNSGAEGYSFSIPAGKNIIGFPLRSPINIYNVYGYSATAPDSISSFSYLVAKTQVFSTPLRWGLLGQIQTSFEIGSGESNTQTIATSFPNITTASLNLLSYTDGTYSDWYLPSRGEFNLLKDYVTLSNTNYWTSSSDPGREKGAFEYKTSDNNFRLARRSEAKQYFASRTTDVTSTQKNLGDTYEGGKIYKINNTTQSSIVNITDMYGNKWSPNSQANTLTLFEPGRAYSFTTTASISFDLLDSENIPVENRSLQFSQINRSTSNAYHEDKVDVVLNNTMKVVISGNVILSAIDDILSSGTHQSESNLQIETVNIFAGQEQAINTFLNGGGGVVGQGHLITHNTLMGIDTNNTTSSIYNNARYKLGYTEKLKVLRNDIGYKIKFVPSFTPTNIVIGSSKEYVSQAKIDKNNLFNFTLDNLRNKNNLIKFKICTLFNNSESDFIFKINKLQKNTFSFVKNSSLRINKLTKDF